MKKIALFLFILMFSLPLLAAENGLFFDPDRDGEGMILLQDNGQIQFSFFTYIERCKHRYFDSESLIVDKSYRHCIRQQAWYITGATPFANGQSIGVLYTANPEDSFYDEEGVPVDTLLADVVDIGLFVLTQNETGFEMIVLQTGDVLHPDAEIYHRTYHFKQFIFGPQAAQLPAE